ncbi:trans-resveratrol di-O-methyltransferase-like protein [Tanacetum coccineum]
MFIAVLTVVPWLHNAAIPKLVEALSHRKGYVEGNGDEKGEGYMLAPASRFLLKEEPLSIRPFLLAMFKDLLHSQAHIWNHIFSFINSMSLKCANSFHITHGRSLWEFAGQEPKLNHLFNEAMASDACLVSSVIQKDSGAVFNGLTSVVDVGGGTGTVAKAIAKAFPDVSCTSFDLLDHNMSLVKSLHVSILWRELTTTDN